MDGGPGGGDGSGEGRSGGVSDCFRGGAVGSLGQQNPSHPVPRLEGLPPRPHSLSIGWVSPPYTALDAH